MKVFYPTEPDALMYMPQPDGSADCWLRKNVEPYEGAEGNKCFIADEVYAKVYMSEEDVMMNFDELFNGNVQPASFTNEERISALENAVLELAMMLGGA